MNAPAPIPALTPGLSVLAPHYDALLCDVWGVLHNGIASFPETSEALTRFRQGGGTVVLISNAPRPGDGVGRILDRLGVPRSAYDDIVTSGDVTRGQIAARPGATVFHVGPPRDLPIFSGLDTTLGPLATADYVVCSGLFDDETETPDDYRAMLDEMRARGLDLLCANPDLVVERGDRLIYCAGAIADLYATLGGEVTFAGKPHGPIYDRVLERVAALRGAPVPLARVLAVGDSVRTDVTGAARAGVDCLFVTAGIHAEELGGRETPDLAVLARILAADGLMPRAVMRRVVW